MTFHNFFGTDQSIARSIDWAIDRLVN